jgi:RNA polymerase sigma factor (sigma-70 family)
VLVSESCRLRSKPKISGKLPTSLWLLVNVSEIISKLNVQDIEVTISAASDSGGSLSVRHEAFAELVSRFQDMAFACAYAVVGDAYLAEDIAQEAFVLAWQKLEQLREPKAFPGWLKRIVLSQCNRLTRGKRLQLVPIDADVQSPTRDSSPHFIVETNDLLNKVLKAIRALPDNERLVTTLFYVNGYTQADIGNFLEVPVSTVNKRLYTARQRLKENVELFKDNLRSRRPSRDRAFSERVTASLRPIAESDWSPIKNIVFARNHSDISGNDLWLHRRQNFDATNHVRRQYVAEDAPGGQLIGFGAIEQTIYLPRYRLFLVTNPSWLKAGVGDLLFDRLMIDLKEANAVTVSCREDASQSDLLAFLERRGFKEVDHVRDSRLNVAAVDLLPLLSVEEKLAESGITFTTLAEERKCDPRCVEKLYELKAILHEDGREDGSFAAPAYNEREALLWLNMPYVLPAAYFIAKDGDRYVGVSDVNRLEALAGALTQGDTGVLPEYRRRGIATTLRAREIEFAQTHGYKVIQSFNDTSQSDLLALNHKLGFEILAGKVTLEKCLKEVVSLSPRIYDEYTGRYRDEEGRPDIEMIVRNEGGRLTLEAVGQKVELFPLSQTQFFVKQFYGEATFVRDESGRVTLMKFVMPEGKNRKASVQNAKRINQ